jgi:hypothetical protein
MGPAIAGRYPRSSRGEAADATPDPAEQFGSYASSLHLLHADLSSFRSCRSDRLLDRLGLSKTQETRMNNIIWIVGAVVIVIFALGFFGIRL